MNGRLSPAYGNWSAASRRTVAPHGRALQPMRFARRANGEREANGGRP
jgi:hypothetical protein